jgi:hypothetical protein
MITFNGITYTPNIQTETEKIIEPNRVGYIVEVGSNDLINNYIGQITVNASNSIYSRLSTNTLSVRQGISGVRLLINTTNNVILKDTLNEYFVEFETIGEPSCAFISILFFLNHY